MRDLVVLQADPEVVLCACHSCHCCQASRFPDDEFLHDLYRAYYVNADAGSPQITAASPGRVGSRISVYAREVLDRRLPASEARILDIGGGDGSIAIDLAHRLGVPSSGWHVTVVEAGQAGSREAEEGILVRTVSEVPRTGSFPVVILSAVLEHLEAPLETLGAALERLATPGVLYVRTPYIAPLMRLAASIGLAIDFTYPAHLYDLGAPFWDGISRWSSILSPADVVIASRASPVEVAFRSAPVRAVASAGLKGLGHIVAPARVLSGGWEWVVARGHSAPLGPVA